MIKVSKLSLLMALCAVPLASFADGTPLLVISSEVVATNVKKYFPASKHQAALNYYAIATQNLIAGADREARSRDAVQIDFEKSYRDVLRATCEQGGVGSMSSTCTNFVTAILRDARQTTYVSPALCLDGHGLNATLSGGTKISTQSIGFGADPCHFLGSPDAMGSDQTMLTMLRNYASTNARLNSIECDNTTTPVTFSDMHGDFRVLKCTLNHTNLPTYFVFGVPTEILPLSKPQQTPPSSNFTACAALPWGILDYVQKEIVLNKIDYNSCQSTVAYYKSVCETFTGDSGKNCMYNHPITSRTWQQTDKGSFYNLHCDVKYNSNQPCASTTSTERKVDAQCLPGDLPVYATSGVYITGGVSRFDCKDANNQIVKCSCAARSCDSGRGYILATKSNGASNGYCIKQDTQPQPVREQIPIIEGLTARGPGQIPTNQPQEQIARIPSPTEQAAANRCTASFGQYNTTTNTCLCSADLHLVVKTNSSGMSYCVCDYENGYITNRAGTGCELTDSARRKLEREQRQQQPQQSVQTPGDGVDFRNPLDDKLILGTEALTAFK